MTRDERAALGILAAILFALWLYSMSYAQAQSNHTQFHAAYYQNWVNQRGKNCCNDQDCGQLREDDERETPAGIEVRIEGKWCPVQEWQYLKRGNAPNWASSHICVVKNMPYLTPLGACERLLCYQPKPGI